jgi:hypothetical protein
MPCCAIFFLKSSDCLRIRRDIIKKVIHVNHHNIRKNRKSGCGLPVITAKTYKSNDYGDMVEIAGPCTVIYRPEKPLSCGATVWIETENEVVVWRGKKKLSTLE